MSGKPGIFCAQKRKNMGFQTVWGGTLWKKDSERKGMDTKDQETAIAYQNKDIVSKLFGERMKGKPLSLFGLGTDLKVADVKPTNLPIVQARELRMDNLFELEDGSVAVLDYESEYKKVILPNKAGILWMWQTGI